MANKFQVNTVLLSGQSLTASSTNLFLNSNRLANASDTGQFISTAQTGLFYPASNPNNYITAAQAGGVSALTVTGASLSGNINLTGIGGLNVSLSGTYILFSGGAGNLGDTGQFVTTAQTGHIHSQYALVAGTGQFISTAQTGQFAPSGMTGQFVTTAQTGHIHSQYALVAGTGQFISTAQTGQFAPSGMTGQFVTTAQTGHIHSQYALSAGTGQFISTAQTGQFAPSGMTGQFITTAVTGNAFYPRYGNPDGFLTNATLPSAGGVNYLLVTGTQVSGNITLVGTGNVYLMTGAAGTNQIVVSGATGNLVFQGMTGQFAPIAQTGHIHSQYALVDGTGQFITTAQTGQFAPSGMTGQFVTTAQTGHIHSQYALVAGTGQFISTAQTGQFAPSGMTGQFVTTAQTGHIHSQYALVAGTGQFISTAQTGQFAPSGMTGQFITTAQTGQYAPAGMTGQFLVHEDTGVLVSRGETGAAFYPRYGNPAGYLTSGAAAGGGVSYLTVSGSAGVSGVVDFSGGSGILIAISGQSIVVSVSPTSLTTVSGIGGIEVISSGSFLLISGSASSGSTGSIGDTGQFITTAQTGQFAPIAQTGHIHSQYALVAGTGQFISTAQTGQFAPSGMTGQFVTTAQTGHIHSQYALVAGTGQFISTAQTGQFAPSGMTGQFVTTAQTGHIHSQYALSAGTGQFISTAQTGVLASTGWVDQYYYPRDNPSGYGQSGPGGGGSVSGVGTTGQYLSGFINITGIGGTYVDISGEFIRISGGSSGPGGNYVTLDTEQVITAQKIFNAEVRISGASVDLDISTSGNDHCIVASGNIDSFYESKVMNLNTGFNASADMVVSSSTDPLNDYVDMGINSDNYSGAMVGYTGDGYVYHIGRNFYIGNVTPGRRMFFFAGHNMTGNDQAQSNVAEMTVTDTGVGFHTGNPRYAIDVHGTGNFTQGLFCSGLPVVLGPITKVKTASWTSSEGIYSGTYTVAAWRCASNSTLTGLHGIRFGGSGCFVQAYKNSTALPLLTTPSLFIGSTGVWVTSGNVQNTLFNIGDTLIMSIVSVSGLPQSVSMQADFLD